jgi:hypothetical protein
MKGVIRGHGDKTRWYIDGQEVTEAVFLEAFPDKPIGDGSGLVGWKPIASDALAVHPSQVEEARADAIKKGVPTDFLPDGRPILRTREHRKEYMRRYGYFDKQGTYGDAGPGSFKGDRPDKPDLSKEY